MALWALRICTARIREVCLYSVVQCRVFSPQSMHFPIVWCVVYIACSLTTNLQRVSHQTLSLQCERPVSRPAVKANWSHPPSFRTHFCCPHRSVPLPCSWGKAGPFHVSPNTPYRTACHTPHVAVGTGSLATSKQIRHFRDSSGSTTNLYCGWRSCAMATWYHALTL